ncbi:unannotated protein [freshwater metagenome]|uniref:Unannotated protein n=1 Tax=freshwater metagenome TaxID=449393 RepID=A0A6J7QG27_9ZZZZ
MRVIGLEHRERARQRRLVARHHVVDGRLLGGEVDVASADELVDHGFEAEALAVLRTEDAHATLAQQFDLGRHDDAATTAEHLYMASTARGQPLLEVAEVFDVAALVRAHRDSLHVFLQSSRDHLLNAAVVAEVNHLYPLRLQDAPHDVDGRVVAVEQTRRRNESHLVHGHMEGVRRIGHRVPHVRSLSRVTK